MQRQDSCSLGSKGAKYTTVLFVRYKFGGSYLPCTSIDTTSKIDLLGPGRDEGKVVGHVIYRNRSLTM